ncbi:MAG: DNA replication/repair protein RecF [Pseudomonadota bacterium]
MPILRKVVITNLRNISVAELNPAPGFNLFCGVNGSGKTSVLEAIHLLALGRSFRSHLQKPVIKDGETTATIFGETSDALGVGIQRSVRGGQLIHINGKKSESLAALSRVLPLQLINSETFQILEGAPKERRHFLDWGVFHVEQPFFAYWRQAKVAIVNRNNLLKVEAPTSEIEPWSIELAKNASQIDLFRAAYASMLELELREIIENLLGQEFGDKFSFKYMRGWSPESDLLQQLHKDFSKDRRYGFTTLGPHKADLYFQFGNFHAPEVLSRGQLKLLICALKIAQSKLFYKATGRHCIFLIDDLPAELDALNREKVCSLLASLEDQIFISSIEEQSLRLLTVGSRGDRQHKVFHVKHGIIN